MLPVKFADTYFMPQDYSAKPGDCFSSIAFEHGFFWETLWNHGSNSELKSKRKAPNVLKEGDIVHIPDLTLREEPGATEDRHCFKLKGVPEKLRIRIEDEEGKPIANVPYKITIDGTHRHGTTDAGGWVIESIPPDARGGNLLVGKKGEEQEHELNLGHLDPIEELTGVQARLRNLGYDCAVDGQLNEQTREALKHFQLEHSLDPTAAPDDATREHLQKEHHS